MLILVLAFVLSSSYGVRCIDTWDIQPNDYLRWNYSRMNPDCASVDGLNPCTDIRICNFAKASLHVGGWPTLCGWVGKTVPKVCCGLPLVLGKRLMKKVDEEKARKRECGRRTMSVDLSPTENKFFSTLSQIPPPDTSDPNKYDPPLDLTQKALLIPPYMGSDPIYPWMVSIFEGDDLLCAGHLIDRIHILTTGNCIRLGREENYIVRVGSRHAKDGYPYKVQKISVPTYYNPENHYNDIALLKLDKEILSPKVPHICLPPVEFSTKDFVGDNLTALSYVDTNVDGKQHDYVIRTMDNVPVVPKSICKESYPDFTPGLIIGVTEDMICAQMPTAPGLKHSGGALMYKNNYENLPEYHSSIPWVLVGIASFGYNCSEKADSPIVYTRVSSHMEWIKENIKT